MASLAGTDAVLLDLDGVLYVEGELIDGAAEAVGRLRDAGKELRFVTNTTAHSRASTLAKLHGFGIELDEAELVTPAALARRHCEQAGHVAVALIMNDEVKADFDGFTEADDEVDAVIMGDLGEQFGFAILNRAFRLVMAGAELVALQKNRFWLTEGGLSLDAGPFVAAVEYASGTEAYVVGKPSAAFFDLVLGDLEADRDSVAMVGDDVETDIGGALEARIAAILVRTGKYREVFVGESGIEPTQTIDSVAQLPELLGA